MNRQKERKLKDRQYLADRRAAANAILDKLGIPRPDYLKAAHRELFYRYSRRPLEIVMLDGSPMDQRAETMAQFLATGLRACHIYNRDMGEQKENTGVPVYDCVRSLHMMRSGFWSFLEYGKRHPGVYPEATTAKLQLAFDEITQLWETTEDEFGRICTRACSRFSSLDTVIYAYDLEWGQVVKIQIAKFPAITATAIIEGKRRPVYRVQEPGGPHAELEGLPVFVQSHTLRRLNERLDYKAVAENRDYLLHRSITKPAEIRKEGNQTVIPLCMPVSDGTERRLGYLYLQRVGDMWVIMTFKFITMEGTPENARLQREIRIRRIDLDYLRLDRLSTFLSTDLLLDPAIADLFKSCGIDIISRHILDKMKTSSKLSTGHAEDFNKYFRLED